MNTVITTDKAPPPFSDYAVAVDTPSGSRWLHISGQVGVSPSGDLAATAEGQHRQAWANILAILGAAGMDRTDIVEVIGIVTDQAQVPVYRVMRDEMLQGHLCASTLLVCGLANPDWKVEIAVRAARVG
jgi:enamine deaminase RidA (YjgF/YER057c/UK114 family)